MSYFKKFKGQGEALPTKSPISEIAFAWFGGFISIFIIGYLTKSYDYGFFWGFLCFIIWIS